MSLLISAFFAAIALLLDYLLAEPKRFHPLVGFGHWAGFWQKQLNPQVSTIQFIRACQSPAVQIMLGAMAVMIVVIPLFSFFWVGLKVLHSFSHWVAYALEALLLYLCIGGRSLQQHVLAVKQELATQDLTRAQEKLSWIVSRETDSLNAPQIAQASIETTLENSSDAIFASLFWFAVGGAPLALLHRWSNTLDAMWGYKNPQNLYFGRIAAYLDDVLNYIPARLTACCFCVFSPRRLVNGRSQNSACYCWKTQAKHCSSPNGGVVMTAGAGALQCTLSEGAYYHGQWQTKPVMGIGKPAEVGDIASALTLVNKSVFLFMAAWLILGLSIAWVCIF
ncbi:adenosylcobinamide-phosphate synthase CbiB [Bacterioplanoides sp.]|uniref:adenosylcobinamide-phosphate synthase CbiB n=1 Tax=Bacterioplanoides sp. TaxID=2066072 RepID=UPI003AFFE3B2